MLKKTQMLRAKCRIKKKPLLKYEIIVRSIAETVQYHTPITREKSSEFLLANSAVRIYKIGVF